MSDNVMPDSLLYLLFIGPKASLATSIILVKPCVRQIPGWLAISLRIMTAGVHLSLAFHLQHALAIPYYRSTMLLNRNFSSLGPKFYASQILFTYQLYELYSHHSQQCLTPTFDIAGGPPNALRRQPKMIVSSMYSPILLFPSNSVQIPNHNTQPTPLSPSTTFTPLSTSSQSQTNTHPPAPFSRPHRLLPIPSS